MLTHSLYTLLSLYYYLSIKSNILLISQQKNNVIPFINYLFFHATIRASKDKHTFAAYCLHAHIDNRSHNVALLQLSILLSHKQAH